LEFATAFSDCEPGVMPPFGNLYDVPVYVYRALGQNERIVFQAAHSVTRSVAYADFRAVGGSHRRQGLRGHRGVSACSEAEDRAGQGPRDALHRLDARGDHLAERAVDVHGHVVQVPERRHHSGLAVGERGGELQLGRQPDRLPRPEERSFSTAP